MTDTATATASTATVHPYICVSPPSTPSPGTATSRRRRDHPLHRRRWPHRPRRARSSAAPGSCCPTSTPSSACVRRRRSAARRSRCTSRCPTSTPSTIGSSPAAPRVAGRLGRGLRRPLVHDGRPVRPSLDDPDADSARRRVEEIGQASRATRSPPPRRAGRDRVVERYFTLALPDRRPRASTRLFGWRPSGTRRRRPRHQHQAAARPHARPRRRRAGAVLPGRTSPGACARRRGAQRAIRLGRTPSASTPRRRAPRWQFGPVSVCALRTSHRWSPPRVDRVDPHERRARGPVRRRPSPVDPTAPPRRLTTRRRPTILERSPRRSTPGVEAGWPR